MKLPNDAPGPSPGEGPAPQASRELGCLRPLGAVAVAVVVVVGVLGGLAVGRCTAPPAPAPAASVTVVHSTPNVVTAVRDLARLEGAAFHMERVIELTERQRRVFGLVEAEDAILLVASGEVVAGVDLSEIGEDDIVVDTEQKSARVTLPPVRILSSRLDNERTRVHSRQTDLLAERRESLETRARREAERTLVAAADEAGIHDRAAKNVRRTVEGLVRSLGYEQVEVEVSDQAD